MRVNGCVIIVGQMMWGRGDDLETAKRQFKVEGGSLKKAHTIIWFEDPKAYMNEMGACVYKKDTRYAIIQEGLK